jgi:hypothetical protein
VALAGVEVLVLLAHLKLVLLEVLVAVLLYKAQPKAIV